MTEPVAPAAPNTPAAPVAPAAPPTPEAWYAKFDGPVKGYVETKGWKDPAEVVVGYQNLEKLVGTPAEQLLRLPKADDAEGMTKVFERLGRPATADGYKVTAPEGANPDFAKKAQAWFHKANLTQTQATHIMEQLTADIAETNKQAAEAEKARMFEGTAKLTKDWGAAYQKNSAIVDGVAREFELSTEQVLALRQAMGTEGAMKFLYSVGKKLGEDTFVAANGGPKGFGNVMTPDAAKARISALKADQEFGKKLRAGNVDAKAEWDRLHQYAFPSA